MIRFLAQFLLIFLGAALPALAADSTRVSGKAPIINFSLPTFTNPDGYRSWLIRGSEAWLTEQTVIDVKELSLTVFSGDSANRIDTLLLSPSARVLTDQQIISGPSSLRVINLRDGFEASGEDWRYTHKNKTVTLAKKARVVLQAEFKNFLQ